MRLMRIVLNIDRITQNMKREYSAGGIVLKGNQVLLIKNAALRDPSKAYWGFPKGHINEGESAEEAAVREIKEETGVEAEIVKKLGESSYIFTKQGEQISKTVVYFLLVYTVGEIKAQDLEVLDAGWYTPKEALAMLSFKKDCEFLENALEMNS